MFDACFSNDLMSKLRTQVHLLDKPVRSEKLLQTSINLRVNRCFFLLCVKPTRSLHNNLHFQCRGPYAARVNELRRYMQQILGNRNLPQNETFPLLLGKVMQGNDKGQSNTTPDNWFV